MTFSDCYNLPVYLRKWWVKKIIDIKEAENKANQQSQ
jgi:hypothetical protein